MSKKSKKVINYMLSQENQWYNCSKCIEELQELSLVLTQRLNKGTEKVPDEKIIEEIGDVKVRLKYLESFFGEKKIETRFNKKIDQLYGYLKSGKYKNL